MSECETCKRLNYTPEYLEFCDLINTFGKSTIDDAMQRAMERAAVKKSRREHVARAIRYFIGEVRTARR